MPHAAQEIRRHHGAFWKILRSLMVPKEPVFYSVNSMLCHNKKLNGIIIFNLRYVCEMLAM